MSAACEASLSVFFVLRPLARLSFINFLRCFILTISGLQQARLHLPFDNKSFSMPLHFFSILLLLNKRKLEKLKEIWWNQNPEKKKCDKQDNQTDGISIHNIGKNNVIEVIFIIIHPTT